MTVIDANGLSCPEPVIKLKKAIEDENEILLLVDNQASAAVCARFAKSKGFAAETTRVETGWSLAIKKI